MEKRNSRITNANSAVAKLVAEMSADPSGKFSASVYETARLVSLAPDAPGHLRRVRFLLAGQQEDGDWGGPDDYRLVPLLSATEALLTVLFRPAGCDEAHALRQNVVSATDRALRAVFRRINRHEPVLPPTFAADIIVPALVGELNAHLTRLEANPLAGLEGWLDDRRLRRHRLPAVGARQGPVRPAADRARGGSGRTTPGTQGPAHRTAAFPEPAS